MNHPTVLCGAVLGMLFATASAEAEVKRAWRLENGAWREVERIDFERGAHPSSGPFLFECGKGPVCFCVAATRGEPSFTLYEYDPQQPGGKGNDLGTYKAEYPSNIAQGDRIGGVAMMLFGSTFNDRMVLVYVDGGIEPATNGFIVHSRSGR
jgi:hypothetical protein